MADFVLRVADIEASGKDYSFPVTRAWMRRSLGDASLGVDEAAGDGSLDLRADRTGSDVLVSGRLRARVVAECVRCLEDAAIDVDTDVTTLFTARAESLRPEPDESEAPEEPDRELYSGEEIVLDALVREHLILEVPMQPLCRDDCGGIEIPEHVRPPADFGEEQDADGVDPRLAPLKELSGKLPSKE